ncbi:aldehyde dehydrogenase family protein, partial [Staphylococcus aureus]
AAGCSIVLKASEEGPAPLLAFARLVHEAGFPAGMKLMIQVRLFVRLQVRLRMSQSIIDTMQVLLTSLKAAIYQLINQICRRGRSVSQ